MSRFPTAAGLIFALAVGCATRQQDKPEPCRIADADDCDCKKRGCEESAVCAVPFYEVIEPTYRCLPDGLNDDDDDLGLGNKPDLGLDEDQ